MNRNRPDMIFTSKIKLSQSELIFSFFLFFSFTEYSNKEHRFKGNKEIYQQKPNMLYQILTIAIVCCVSTEASQKSVYFYKSGQLVTSSTLIWQTFTGDKGDLEHAVHAAKYVSDEENYQIYVCRALIEGLYVAGHTQKHEQKTICLVSTHQGARIHHTYDVLLNKGYGGKLTWKAWNKFSATTPTGAVSAISTGHVGFHLDDTFMIDSLILKHFKFVRLKILMWQDVRHTMKATARGIITPVLITMLADMCRKKLWAESLWMLIMLRRWVELTYRNSSANNVQTMQKCKWLQKS